MSEGLHTFTVTVAAPTRKQALRYLLNAIANNSDAMTDDIIARAEALLPKKDGGIWYAGRVAHAMQLDRDRALAALVPGLLAALKAECGTLAGEARPGRGTVGLALTEQDKDLLAELSR